ncbi:F-box domain [Cordyceps militaris]|uniref:F-box domain n=1 Tax=Cordyceps militaris TaxID=73501 RepID=A0A2H4SJ71_CORMI|nr:F-box domain [Cordyceps militaris]
MNSETSQPWGLSDCPVEILLDIASHLDLDSIFKFSLACKCLHGVFNRNKIMIFLEVLSKEFSPFDELLQVYMATVEDVNSCPYYQPRTVVFKRFPGDTGYAIGPQLGHMNHGARCSAETDKQKTSTFRTTTAVASSGVAVLTEDDMKPILQLLDLHETMKDVILHYICPRLDPTYQLSRDPLPLMERVSREYSLNAMWNDQSKWSRIVKTYAKLSPKELMHYFENIYSYTRKRLITEIRLQRPTFNFDQESLQGVIQCVLEERQFVDSLPIVPEDCEGGILDFGDERDEQRVKYGQDGRADGMLPPGVLPVRQFSRYSPRGDDGEYLEDELRSVFEVHGYSAMLQA